MAVTAVAVAATGFEVAELRELAQVTLGGGGGEAEMSDDGFSGEIVFIATKAKISTSFSAKVGFIDHLSTIFCFKIVLSTIFSAVK